MLSNSRIREVNATTKRLVERCLSGEWCTSLMELRKEAGYGIQRAGSPSSDASTIVSPPGVVGMSMAAAQHLEASGANKVMKNMKFSKSVENFGRTEHSAASKSAPRSAVDQERRASNSSVHSLPAFVSPPPSAMKMAVPPSSLAPKKRSTSATTESLHSPSRHNSLPNQEGPTYHYNPDAPSAHVGRPNINPLAKSVVALDVDSIAAAADALALHEQQPRRRPPPPPKRRKPPAIPIGHTNSGATITSIRSSEPSPLSKVHKPPLGVHQAF